MTPKRTHTDLINTYINQIHTDINLKAIYENNGCISFLDLLIIRKQPNLEIDIIRKPTTADKTINFLSNHPIEHQVAAVRLLHHQNAFPPTNTKEETKRMRINKTNRTK